MSNKHAVFFRFLGAGLLLFVLSILPGISQEVHARERDAMATTESPQHMAPTVVCSPDDELQAIIRTFYVGVKFGAKWCGPCRLMERDILTKEGYAKLAQVYKDFRAIDTGADTADAFTLRLLEKYRLNRGIPDTIILRVTLNSVQDRRDYQTMCAHQFGTPLATDMVDILINRGIVHATKYGYEAARNVEFWQWLLHPEQQVRTFPKPEDLKPIEAAALVAALLDEREKAKAEPYWKRIQNDTSLQDSPDWLQATLLFNAGSSDEAAQQKAKMAAWKLMQMDGPYNSRWVCPAIKEVSELRHMALKRFAGPDAPAVQAIPVFMCVAEVLQKEGETIASQNSYRQAAELLKEQQDSSPAGILYYAGMLYRYDIPAALGELRRLETLDPYLAYSEIATLLTNEQKWEEGEAMRRRALEYAIGYERVNTMDELATVLLYQGETAEAVAVIDQALQEVKAALDRLPKPEAPKRQPIWKRWLKKKAEEAAVSPTRERFTKRVKELELKKTAYEGRIRFDEQPKK